MRKIRAGVEAGESRAKSLMISLRGWSRRPRRPETGGFGSVVWALPVLLGAGTFLVVIRRLRKSTGSEDEQDRAPVSAAEDTVTAARIDAELYAMD